MRKILLILTILLVSSYAFAGGILKQSTATTINIGPFTTIATGAVHTGITVTGISITVTKQTDTLSATVTTWSATTSGGGTHDCIETAKGRYNCEITATDTDTLGRFDVDATVTNDYVVTDSFMVIPTDSYAFLVNGDIADLADFFGYAAASVTDQNSIFYLVKNVDVPVSGIPTEVFDFSVPEPTGPLGATPTFGDLQGFLKQWTHNKLTVTSTGGGGFTKVFFNDAGTSTAKQTGTDNGTVYTINTATTP